MKIFVVLLIQIDSSLVQYVGNDEEKARDIKTFEDYNTFIEINSGMNPGGAHFKMHVWENGKGLYNEYFYEDEWEKKDTYNNM